jgi:uncharacterized protein YggE
VRRLIYLVASVTIAGIMPAAAQQMFERSISVTGEGQVSATPDTAIVRAGVSIQAKTAQAASDADNKAMAAVLDALKQDGIAAKDIQTSQFDIHPVYQRHDNVNRVAGFQVMHQVSVTVREIGKLGDVLDRMIAAGANQVSGIQFIVSNSSRLIDKARIEAVQDARRKAETLAKAAGVGIGRAIMISEEGVGAPRPVMFRAAAARAAPTPVAIGEETLRVNVSVTFELRH